MCSVLSVKAKLALSANDLARLLLTIERYNQACNFIAQYGFENSIRGKYDLHHALYHKVREQFKLSSQMAVRAFARTSSAMKVNRSVCPHFSPHASIDYDQRILSLNKRTGDISILALNGRIKCPIQVGPAGKDRLAYGQRKGGAKLQYRNGALFLCFAVEIADAPLQVSSGVLGVDMGEVNLAVDSDGHIYSGLHVRNAQKRLLRLKSALQSTGTHNAKRHLRKLKSKEQRFRTDTNHVVSKRLVANAFDTRRAIALEDLYGIREACNRKTVNKHQRRYLNSWAFYQLGFFIRYKAQLKGVTVQLIDPAYTSQVCPKCGHVDSQNRTSQSKFECVECGLAGLADHVAAINIAARAVVTQPIAGMIEPNTSILSIQASPGR